MTESSAHRDRLRAILVLAATAATITFNFIASAGYVNGVTPAEISDKYPTQVTPAGYAFSIWSLIYLGLAAFSIYQVLPSNWARFGRVRTLYIVTSLLNCSWVYFWHHEMIVACFAIIVLLAVTFFFINESLQDVAGTAEYWLVKAPFGVYFGWVTAAALINFAVMLTYLGVQLSAAASTWISVVLILAAAAAGIWVRVRQTNYMHPLAVAWASTAIAVKQSGETLIVVACAICVVACLIAAFSFVVNLPSHSATEPAAK